jgi:hypothetical protein
MPAEPAVQPDFGLVFGNGMGRDRHVMWFGLRLMPKRYGA